MSIYAGHDFQEVKMRYAICKTGESAIFQIMEVPDAFIKDCTPKGYTAYPVEQRVSDATHIIVNGKAVPKEVDKPAD